MVRFLGNDAVVARLGTRQTCIPTDETAEMPQERFLEWVAEQIVYDRVIKDRMDCGCVSNRKGMTESTAMVVKPMMTDECQAAGGDDDMPGGMDDMPRGMSGGGSDDASDQVERNPLAGLVDEAAQQTASTQQPHRSQQDQVQKEEEKGRQGEKGSRQDQVEQDGEKGRKGGKERRKRLGRKPRRRKEGKLRKRKTRRSRRT